MSFDTLPENAADIHVLEKLLEALPIDGVLTYQQMEDAIGRPIQAHRFLLLRARENVEERAGALFETVRQVGMKRLQAADMPDVGLSSLRKIKRSARRGMERLSNVRANDLSETDAHRVLAYRSQLGAIALAADGRKTQTIAAEVKRESNVIPAGRVLEMLRT